MGDAEGRRAVVVFATALALWLVLRWWSSSDAWSWPAELVVGSFLAETVTAVNAFLLPGEAMPDAPITDVYRTFGAVRRGRNPSEPELLALVPMAIRRVRRQARASIVHLPLLGLTVLGLTAVVDADGHRVLWLAAGVGGGAALTMAGIALNRRWRRASGVVEGQLDSLPR